MSQVLLGEYDFKGDSAVKGSRWLTVWHLERSFVYHHRSSLLSTLTDDGPGCFDCVGSVDTVAAFNMVNNVNEHLGVIADLFPNIQHLTVDGRATQNVTLFLPALTQQTSLTLRDVNFDRIYPSIRTIGSRIRRLNFSGKTTALDISMLAEACPNLDILGVTHSQIVDGGSNPGNIISQKTSPRFLL